MAQYNANLDIVRELLVSTLVVTENYVTGPSVKDETSTMDYVFIGDHEECRNSKMEVTDYAVFCGCDQDYDRRNAHAILTRTPYEYYIMCKSRGQTDASFWRGDKTKFTYGIKPMIKLDIRAFVKYKDRLMKAPGVILGEMPQSVVHNMPLAAIMGKANKTGKVYPGHLGKLNEEYECGGDKYVLVQEGMPNYQKGREYPTSSKRIEQKKAWFEVAPIVWQIQNFDEMPKEINPKGTGTAKHVILQAEKVIMSGIPFSLSPAKGSTVWKDSDLRLFLNGAKSKISYTHPEVKERITYDFKTYNFLDTCLEYNIAKQQKFEDEVEVPAYTPKEKEEEEEVSSKPKKKAEIKNANLLKVTISDKELSVDEQIKFYIDNGKSFMLHGPSGVGKTRRVEEADPDFVSIVLRNGMLPEEVIGKTIFPNNDTAKESLWMPPVWYTNLCQKCEAEPEKNHVLFIDEIT
ncbi:MAG: ATP-binding protein, partial [Clostridia bacterium]|nr:ATP-binding protein [Clostridia bacterium]